MHFLFDVHLFHTHTRTRTSLFSMVASPGRGYRERVSFHISWNTHTHTHLQRHIHTYSSLKRMSAHLRCGRPRTNSIHVHMRRDRGTLNWVHLIDITLWVCVCGLCVCVYVYMAYECDDQSVNVANKIGGANQRTLEQTWTGTTSTHTRFQSVRHV